MFLDITVLREKLKKEQMERERYENEANHQRIQIHSYYDNICNPRSPLIEF